MRRSIQYRYLGQHRQLVKCAVAVLCFVVLIAVLAVTRDQLPLAKPLLSFSSRTLKDTAESPGSEASDDGPGCNPKGYSTQEEQCAESAKCDTGGMINYLNWYYCGGVRWLKLIVFVLFLVLLFYLLGTVAEEFFCPTLAVISEMLHMSPDVAGITILALGNGAPDIFSSFAAVTEGQVDISLGALVGAGSFVTMVVVGAVALSANCMVDQFPFCRDVAGYLIGAACVCAIVLSGAFRLWMAICFLVYYVLYVSISIGVNVVNNRRMAEAQAKLEDQIIVLSGEETQELTDHYSSAVADADKHIMTFSPKTVSKAPQISITGVERDHWRSPSPTDSSDNSDDHDALLLPPSSAGRSRQRTGSVLVNPKSPLHGRALTRSIQPRFLSSSNVDYDGSLNAESVDKIKEHYKHKEPDNLDFLASSLDLSVQISLPAVGSFLSPEEAQEAQEDARITRQLRKRWFKFDPSMFHIPWRRLPSLFLRRIEWSDKTWYEKIGWVVVSPVTLALNLTIPQIEEDSWHKLFAVLNPVFAPFLICLVVSGYDNNLGGVFPLWALLLLIGVVISVVVFFTTTSKPPKRIHLFLFSAFILSIMWIYIVANELVSLLQSFGLILNISPAILGLTVLAWGNSTGDLISDIVIAKQGFPQMALAATFGGPLFNMLMGLGISMTVSTITIFPNPYPASMTPTLAIGFSFLLIGLSTTLLTIPYAGWNIPRKYAIYLIFIYILQILLSVLVETNIIHF